MRIGIGLGLCQRQWVGTTTPTPAPSPLTAPVIALAVPGNTYPPQISVTVDETYAENDVIALHTASSLAGTYTQLATATLNAAAISSGTITFSGLSSISSPTQTWFKAYGRRSGYADSAASNVVKHGDVVGPTVTSTSPQTQSEFLPMAFAVTANEDIEHVEVIGGADGGWLTGSGATITRTDGAVLSYLGKSSYAFNYRVVDYGGNYTDASGVLNVTQDAPAAFSFTGNVTNATLSTQYADSTGVFSGLTPGIGVPFTLTGTFDDFRIHNGTSWSSYYTSTTGLTVQNGYKVEVRLTSGAVNDTTTSATLTISGVSATASVQTPATLPATPSVWAEANTSYLFQTNTGTTSVADTNVVGTWKDRSGNNFDLTARANDTTRPTFDANAGHGRLNFNGTSTALRRLSSLGLWNANGYTAVIALKSNSNAAARHLMAAGNQSQSNLIMQMVGATSGSPANDGAFYRDDTGTVNVVPSTTTVYANAFDGTDRVLMIVDDGSGITAYLDGVAGTRVAYTRGTNALTDNIFAIGALVRSGDSASLWFAAYVYGFAVWPGKHDFTSTERGTINTYFGALQGRTI